MIYIGLLLLAIFGAFGTIHFLRSDFYPAIGGGVVIFILLVMIGGPYWGFAYVLLMIAIIIYSLISG